MELAGHHAGGGAQPPGMNALAAFANRLRPKLLISAVTGVSLAPLLFAAWLARRMEVRSGWIILFIIFGLLLMVTRWIKIGGDPSAGNPGWQDLAMRGLAELTVTFVLAALTFLTRFLWSGMPGLWILVLAYFLIGLVVCGLILGWFLNHNLVIDVLAMADLALGPLLLAWFIVSAVQGSMNVVEYMVGYAQTNDAGHAGVAAARTARLHAWPGKRLAVMLSGEGYRAAMIHAGILSVLDQAQIPIEMLSTVSGGSIIGAAYAAGWTPREFENYLAAKRPGLPDDLLNATNLTASLIWPYWSSGDTYRLHFDRVYFHGMRVAELGMAPLLILNATDYSILERAAFFPPDNDGDLLAGLVASSGAFPVAFDPIRIGKSLYSDGGVIENLGVEGLRQYLQSHPRVAQPDVLLISDASAEPRIISRVPKPTFLEQASGALEAQFVALNRRIFALYAGQDASNQYKHDSTALLVQPYLASANALWRGRAGSVKVFILSPTSPAELSRFGGYRSLVQKVAAMSTLHEPSAEEADDAFWAGAHLASVYLPQICAAVGQNQCAAVKVPPPPTPRTGTAAATAFREMGLSAIVFLTVFIVLRLFQRNLQLRLVNDCVKLVVQTSIVLVAVYLVFLVAWQTNYLPHKNAVPPERYEMSSSSR